MPVLTVLPSGKTCEVAHGSTLLQALLAAGAPIRHKCHGRAQCESCHVRVLEGRSSLSAIRLLERQKLARLNGASDASRLACQAVLGEAPVTVELMPYA